MSSNSWRGNLVGRMHDHRITGKELAKELGVTDRWISAVINGHRDPKNAELLFNAAVNSIIERREDDTPCASN